MIRLSDLTIAMLPIDVATVSSSHSSVPEPDSQQTEAYRRAHVDKLALLFTPKPETGKGRRRSKRRRSPLHGLPPELIRRVVEYWAHAGCPVSSCDQYSRATLTLHSNTF